MVDQKKTSEFAEPIFYTFLEKWLQIKWSSVLVQLQKKHSAANNDKTFPESPNLLAKYKILFEPKMIHDSYWTMASGFLGVFVKAKGDQGEQGRWKKGQIFCLHIRVKLILVHLRSSNFSLLKYVHSKMFRKIISPFVIIYLKSKNLHGLQFQSKHLWKKT